MAKPYQKNQVGYMRHRKFLALNANAVALWHEGKDYCSEHLTDGLIPASAVRGFRFKSKKAIELLTTSCGMKPDGTAYAPLWESHDIGFKMHDYLEHNDSYETVQARIAKVEEKREGERRRQAEYRERERRKGERRADADGDAPREPQPTSRVTYGPVTPPTSTSTGTSTAPNGAVPARARGPLVIPPKAFANVAHFSPLGDVPNALHSEFVRKVMNGGASEPDADAQVRAFYALVEARYAGQVVGDKPMDFWRARFGEAAPRTTTMDEDRGFKEFMNGAR